ncbi:BolA family protein [Hydrogenovibrio kuenenii]|uniref:BolA family protein n=1 Tax=Hydrogenovibrio kuenenii TaxID=63658 RepID=UPI00046535BC|nr:BolA family protein [Hydrogenovibrio kuenenii]
MSPDNIRNKIQTSILDAQVVTSGEDCNFAIEVVSSEFEGKTPLQRHRMVNDIFKQEFESGALHALSIKTAVPKKD